MERFDNGIIILPENLRMLQVLTEEEIGLVLKALAMHVTGVDPDVGQLPDKLSLVYEILKTQNDRMDIYRHAAYFPEKLQEVNHETR